MADEPQNQSASASNTTALNIPEETAKKFPELIEMIKGSRSMNDEERQYWIDVLPIMTEDQVENLRGILVNEKKQIEEAEKSYKKNMMGDAEHAMAEFDELKYREKKRMRLDEEKRSEEEEKGTEENLLKELEQMNV